MNLVWKIFSEYNTKDILRESLVSTERKIFSEYNLFEEATV